MSAEEESRPGEIPAFGDERDGVLARLMAAADAARDAAPVEGATFSPKFSEPLGMDERGFMWPSTPWELIVDDATVRATATELWGRLSEPLVGALSAGPCELVVAGRVAAWFHIADEEVTQRGDERRRRRMVADRLLPITDVDLDGATVIVRRRNTNDRSVRGDGSTASAQSDASTVAQEREFADRILGMLVGGGLGDALGAPVEFSSLRELRARPEGLVRGPEPSYGLPFALTDDTQMTLFTAEAAIEWVSGTDGRTFAELGWQAYQRWLATQSELSPSSGAVGLLADRRLYARRAPGSTCLSALQAGVPGSLHAPINNSKGCGGVMRIAPVAAVSPTPFVHAAELSALTHGHPTSHSASGVFAELLAAALVGPVGDASRPPIDETTVIEALATVSTADAGETVAAVEHAVRRSRLDDPTPEALEGIGAGWVAEEALAIAIWCVLVEPDPVKSLRLAVNHSGDSDSTGSMVGQLMGAAHGTSIWPLSWLADLELSDLIIDVSAQLAAAGDAAGGT